MNTIAVCDKIASSSNTNNPSNAKENRLDFDIHSCSSYSASYYPQNILLDRPLEQSSRWSSGSNNQAQYIITKLKDLSIVKTITFGKYHKVHVCNLKEFKVYGGVDLDNMLLLLHAGLRNDSEKETFSLKHQFGPVTVPILYMKIVPLLAHGANFNFSIWYVELRGANDSTLLESTYKEYINYKESEVIRLCLKHFRQRNLLSAFSTLHKHAPVPYEDPLMSELHKYLVLQGDFTTAEEFLIQASERGLFSEYIAEFAYKPIWRRIMQPAGSEGPCMRGGHQMAPDSKTGGRVYMFGGWDGSKDLADLWCFEQEAQKWTCISLDTRRQGGPGPRSCHKICYDEGSKLLYVLGRYVDPEARPNVNLECDFWAYNTESGKWRRLSANTSQDGGPELIYDHQMVIDSDSQTLYTFGGRNVGPDSNVTVYSGLYSYDIVSNLWTLLRSDSNQTDQHSIHLKSRIGHSMLLNPVTKQLYIFAGQRNKDYMSDFYIYDIAADRVSEVSRDYSVQGGPHAGFTQRAAIDVKLGEIYMLSGLMREKNNPSELVKNSFWVYNIGKNKWSRIYQNENLGAEYWEKMKDTEPCPRFAHQLAYDCVSGKQYMFGGNPGDVANTNLRLDDFWELSLERPKMSEILKLAQFAIRKEKFKEMCETPKEALKYLQTAVHSVVSHSDENQSNEFCELSFWLFGWNDAGSGPDYKLKYKGFASGGKESGDATSFPLTSGGVGEGGGLLGAAPLSAGAAASPIFYTARSELFEKLLEFFPARMKEPAGNLVDLVLI